MKLEYHVGLHKVISLLCASSHRFRNIFYKHFKFLIWKMWSRSRSRPFTMVPLEQTSKSNNAISHFFALPLSVSGILTVQIFYHENVGHGHGVRLSRWRHSMANSKICTKVLFSNSAQALTILKILTFKMYDLLK